MSTANDIKLGDVVSFNLHTQFRSNPTKFEKLHVEWLKKGGLSTVITCNINGRRTQVVLDNSAPVEIH